MAQSPDLLAQQLRTAVNLLQGLGFVINGKRSLLVPAQQTKFLGFVINSVDTTLSLPSRKVSKIQRELRRTLARTSISLRQIARVVGLLSSSIQAIFPAPYTTEPSNG